MYEELIEQLNAKNREERLDAIRKLTDLVKEGKIAEPVREQDVNNHIHTTYSFSPYSPTKAVWMGYMAGLRTIGIMDHDSDGGAEEFIKAAEIVGIAATCGVETRVKMNHTALNGKLINNPDQKSIAYVAMHGIPHTQFGKVRAFFAPYTAKRCERDLKMTERLNEILNPYGIRLDFEKDVRPLSMNYDSGSVTERHLLYAVALKMMEKFGKGEALVSFLENDIRIPLSEKVRTYLLDTQNPYYAYDLLGALKSNMVAQFYINAEEECPDVTDFIQLAKEVHAVSAYAYLGDVTNSVTGDKKAQKFEDDYLDLLFDTLRTLGFNAVTYMPSRNTLEQLRRVRSLCDKYGFFQISGEDINSPRQKFICMAQRDKEFSNLYDAAWALIGHEIAATEDLKDSMFSEETIAEIPSLSKRIERYKNIALSHYEK